MTRSFEDKQAVRTRVPLMIGIMGPSGGGKTFSALRLASGMQRVTGGDTFVIDTEARRALHYADQFKFRHVQFDAPFSPSDYLAAIEHCIKRGATTVVVDSMSHEHEGPGGVLEMHEAELERLSGGDRAKAERVKMLAWSKPKQERRRLINSVLQRQCNMIFCFRAKEKIKPEKGGQIQELGFMPIAGEEFLYEMTVNFLLLPTANGEPTWQTDMRGEKQMIKLPKQFRSLFTGGSLSEEQGEAMAKWAAGDAKPEQQAELSPAALGILAAVKSAETHDAIEAQKSRANEVRKKLSALESAAIRAALDQQTELVNNMRQPGDDFP